MNKGEILDVYPEGSETIRVCVLDVKDANKMAWVVDLNTGKTCWQEFENFDEPIINVFSLEALER